MNIRTFPGRAGALTITAITSTLVGNVAVSHADSWSQQADAACADIYDTMGVASRIGNANVNLAMFDYWHAKVLWRTVDALSAIPGPSELANRYIKGLGNLATLETDEADHWNSLTYDVTGEIIDAKDALQANAAALNIPSCDQIVQGP